MSIHRPKAANYALRTKHTCVSRFFHPKNSVVPFRGPRLTPQNGCAILRGPRTPGCLCISFLSPHKMATQFCGGPDLFTPRTHLVRPWGPRTPALICGERIALYLVPLARSRYCASPEASILTKAKAKLEHPPTEGRQLRTKN